MLQAKRRFADKTTHVVNTLYLNLLYVLKKIRGIALIPLIFKQLETYCDLKGYSKVILNRSRFLFLIYVCDIKT